MLRQVEIKPDVTLAQLQSRLRQIESRIGEIADIAADEADDADGGEVVKVTVATANNRSSVPANSLVIVLGGAQAPSGKSLELAGTAWVEGKKQVAVIYR